jgi:tetratricopeptide (TPR) repeat protein
MQPMQDNVAISATDLEREVHALMHSGKLREAAAACDRLNHQFPDQVSGWFTASQLALQVNEPQIAVRAIDRALALSPGQPELLLQKVTCLGAADAVGEARVLAERLGGHLFANSNHASACGLAMSRLGLHEMAKAQFARAVDLEPGNSGHYYNLATTLRFLGELDAAAASLNRAIELNPDDAEAHYLRSGLRTQSTEQNHIEELNAAIERATDDRGRVRLGFTLAKEYEDIGENGKSFTSLSQAAALRRNGMQYQPERELETMQSIRDTFDADRLSQGGGHTNAAPIFVIGMPRTGTTLVDRILDSHSVVTSAGELQAFSIELQKQCQQLFESPPQSPSELVRMSAQIDFEALGEAYINATRGVAGDGAHFVDKLPFNFLYAGLIHLALPKAKIVLLQRDPMDTCYAVYKTLFDAAYPFSYDLEELANYFVAYHQLVEHWFECLPGRIHTVRYEELVSDSQPVIENLLDYCGLSYEESCLRFYENREASTTASASQVRSAMHTRSIGNWKNYTQQLQTIYDILAQAGVIDANETQ